MDPTTAESFARLEIAARMAMAADDDADESSPPAKRHTSGFSAGFPWIFWTKERDKAGASDPRPVLKKTALAA